MLSPAPHGEQADDNLFHIISLNDQFTLNLQYYTNSSSLSVFLSFFSVLGVTGSSPGSTRYFLSVPFALYQFALFISTTWRKPMETDVIRTVGGGGGSGKRGRRPI